MNNGHDSLQGETASRPSTPEEVRRGKTDMILAVHEGQVVVRYPQPMLFVTMDPENARVIAESIAKAAYEAHYGMAPPDSASELARQARDRFTEAMRIRMINRVALMLNSETLIQMTPKDRALRVVDILMKELA